MQPDLQEKLALYLKLLRKWQKSINLISNNTLDDAWQRHFEDSLQLADFVPENAVLFDLGSGAGFPGLVLAIARPDLAVTLIESDTKKCTFLSTVSRETMTDVSVVNQRIENVSRETIPTVVSARALSALDKLLDYALPWALENPDLMLLLLKGENAETEITEAQKRYDFRCESFPSKTGNGVLLKLTDLALKPVS